MSIKNVIVGISICIGVISAFGAYSQISNAREECLAAQSQQLGQFEKAPQAGKVIVPGVTDNPMPIRACSGVSGGDFFNIGIVALLSAAITFFGLMIVWMVCRAFNKTMKKLE